MTLNMYKFTCLYFLASGIQYYKLKWDISLPQGNFKFAFIFLHVKLEMNLPLGDSKLLISWYQI